MSVVLRTLVFDWSAQTEEEYESTKMLVGTLASTCVNRWLAVSRLVAEEKFLTPYGKIQTLDHLVNAFDGHCKHITNGLVGLHARSFISLNGWELNIHLKNGYVQPILIHTDIDEHRLFIEAMYKTALNKDREKPLTLVEAKKLWSEIPHTAGVIIFSNKES